MISDLAAINQTLRTLMAPSPLDDFLKFTSFLTGLTSLIAIYIGIKSIREQEKTESLSRNLDVIFECQKNYRAAEAPRLARKFPKNGDPILELSITEIESFYRNYWSIKSDQFDFWLSGYVDYDTFMTWNTSTVRHFIQAPEVKFFGADFLEGWIKYGRPYHVALNPLFVGFTDILEYQFRGRREGERDNRKVDFKVIEKLLDIIGDFDRLNMNNSMLSRPTRRFGAPVSLEQFKKDISTVKRQIADIFKIRFSDSICLKYDIDTYGNVITEYYDGLTRD